MKNKKTIEEVLKGQGYTLGTYNQGLEKLTKKALKEVLDKVAFYPTSNTVVTIRGVQHMVEAYEVGNEIDFTIQTLEDYIDNGGEYEED